MKVKRKELIKSIRLLVRCLTHKDYRTQQNPYQVEEVKTALKVLAKEQGHSVDNNCYYFDSNDLKYWNDDEYNTLNKIQGGGKSR